MRTIIFNRDQLRDKIYGCWLGKSIGGTLGMPYEGLQQVQDSNGYLHPTGEPAPNDDLDLQIVWLWALQDRGPLGVNAAVLGEYWLNYIVAQWSEYANCKANQRLGLTPPFSGSYNNYFADSNGAWIRTEIWACLAPGCPDVATRYACEDASVDHGFGEGTIATIFTAAVQSAAFVISDREELINIGLSRIPAASRVAKSIKMALAGYQSGRSWRETRDLLYQDAQDQCWFAACGNLGFIVLAWMYGEGDFGRSLKIAVDCADDTDSTAGTLASILGIIGGASSLPPEWTQPVGDKILTLCLDRTTFPPKPIPATVTAFVDSLMALLPQVLGANKCPVAVSDQPTDTTGISSANYMGGIAAKKILDRPPYSVVHDFIHTRVLVDYGKDPVIKSGEPFDLRLVFDNLLPDARSLELTWLLPDGWRVLPSDKSLVSLNATDVRRPLHREIRVQVLAGKVKDAVNRGVLQMVAHGRPTVGLIPLLFLNGDTPCEQVYDGDRYAWTYKDDKVVG
jgi:ADP-ribosylglycohydrolase